MTRTPLEAWISRKIAANGPLPTRVEIDTWQLQRLNETLKHARSRSVFYRKHFADTPAVLTSLDELDAFPFTTAADLRRNPIQFLCVSQDEIQRVVTLLSSGTTGEPKRFFFTEDDQELTIDFFGVGMTTLVNAGDRVMILLPCTPVGSVGDLLQQGLEREGVFSIPYGPVRNPEHALESMRNQKPDCLVGNPSQLLGLARRSQPGQHSPSRILLSTDYAAAAIVRELENTWGCEVFDHYGATEMGLGGGVECAAHHGYHLREADLYFEIIDPISGLRQPDGAYGEVVVSTLTRRGMPLIRYRMGDKSRNITERCPCGTLLKTMEKISGRFDGFVYIGREILRLPDLDEALFAIPDLLNFSASLTGQRGKEALEIDVQMLTETDCSKQVTQAIEKNLPVSDIKVVVQCHYNPGETGSLQKRILRDIRE